MLHEAHKCSRIWLFTLALNHQPLAPLECRILSYFLCFSYPNEPIPMKFLYNCYNLNLSTQLFRFLLNHTNLTKRGLDSAHMASMMSLVRAQSHQPFQVKGEEYKCSLQETSRCNKKIRGFCNLVKLVLRVSSYPLNLKCEELQHTFAELPQLNKTSHATI